MSSDVPDPQVERAEALEELQHALVLGDAERRDRATAHLKALDRTASLGSVNNTEGPSQGWRWTNESVVPLLQLGDPVDVIIDRARQITLAAMNDGWGADGPPYDPIALAERLNLDVRPTQGLDDIDAQLVVTTGRPRIDFNPVRPANRRRFSLAHEIAHTLFDDFAVVTRNRSVHRGVGDDWQLETLCNAAAAEILMPAGSFTELVKTEPTIERLLDLRREYGVSTEAALNRFAHLTDLPVMTFAASKDGDSYRIDYAVASRSWPMSVQHWRQHIVPQGNVLDRCNAIGHTAKSEAERWVPHARVECVGLPPYQGFSTIRVAGIAFLPSEGARPVRHFEEVLGDATRPVTTDRRPAVAMLVNDKAKTWRGAFANAVRRRWPRAQSEYQAWVAAGHQQLGSVCRIDLEEVALFAMVAQKGYGPAVKTRVRYDVLRACLRSVGVTCEESNLSLHIPRIGAGEAKGDWSIISELITDEVTARGVPVTVYIPPGQRADQITRDHGAETPTQVSLFAGS